VSLSFTKHVTEDLWVDYLEGRIDAAHTLMVQSHLQTGCEQCNRQLAYWMKFLAALERGRSVAPSTAVLQRAYDLFETLAPRPSVWVQLVAQLVSDSRQRLIPVGARSGRTTSFNLVYEASDVSVSLWCERDASSWQITGQVSPPAGFWNVMATGNESETGADVDNNGEFRLQNIITGQYQLVLRGAEQEILLPDINL